MADYLAPLKEADVAAFYRRLALSIQAKFSGDSLAAILLLHWLDGAGKVKVYPAKYVKDLEEVRSYLKDTAREMFLSRKPAPSGRIGGVVPRIKGTIASVPPGPPYSMHLEGNVEASITIQTKAALGLNVDPRELDALYALHGFTVISDVVASVAQVGKSQMYNVTFDKWTCKASDEYHWDPSKHITVPNPDYNSKAPGAVAPGDKDITVYHSNAIRIEKAGLAKAFHDESEAWDVTDQTIKGPDTVKVA
jgi:hypothetical protein